MEKKTEYTVGDRLTNTFKSFCVLITARDLELEVNEDDIEQEHEDELMTKELPTIVHVQTYLAESTLSHNNFVLFRNVIKEVVDLTRQINLGVDSYDVKELTVNELILVQELESSDPVQSEGITVEIFSENLSSVEKALQIFRNVDSNEYETTFNKTRNKTITSIPQENFVGELLWDC
ncbi:hypothetical protein TNCV_4586221 [Trichonephila clavipes]|nr:hypothetical protein TNCV_4586221 [Trichonephila clavipes]